LVVEKQLPRTRFFPVVFQRPKKLRLALKTFASEHVPRLGPYQSYFEQFRRPIYIALSKPMAPEFGGSFSLTDGQCGDRER